ncbi:hypothetical protein P9112_006055 [Eukaryota sp. TZLM1-RC]
MSSKALLTAILSNCPLDLPIMLEGNHYSSDICNEIDQVHPNRPPNWRTELCRTFFETGYCQFGSLCNFAHSADELQPKKVHPLFRTQKCLSFFRQGYCCYGNRCRFSHRDKNLPTGSKKHQNDLSPSACIISPSAFIKIPNPQSDEEVENLYPPKQTTRKRLSIFKKFTRSVGKADGCRVI